MADFLLVVVLAWVWFFHPRQSKEQRQRDDEIMGGW